MKQTAVEFLVEKIKPLYIGNFEMTFLKEIEQAKEMEKQQQGYSEEDMFIAMGFASAIDNNIDAETKLGLCTDFIKNFKNKKI
jgi:hypothetical protein